MVYIILNTVALSKHRKAVVKITLGVGELGEIKEREYLIRPNVHVKKEALKHLNIDKGDLLQAAPFCDRANELIETIAAHSVRFLSKFQYRLFVNEFKTIGYNCSLNFQTLDYILKRLKLSPEDTEVGKVYEQLFPDDFQKSKNLSEAAQLQSCFDMLNNRKVGDMTAPQPQTNPLSQLAISEPLLRKPGVYFFKDNAGEVIYVGKAKRIRERIQSHFNNPDPSKSALYDEVGSIDLEYTGSDLIAQLLESHEIKRLCPRFNTQQVKTPEPFQILIKENKKGIKRFVLERKDYTDDTSEVYFNRNSAKSPLRELCATYNLCPKFCSLERIAGPCSAYKTGSCRGVCAGGEDIEQYNLRVDKALQALLNERISKIIRLPGRIKGEYGFVLVTNAIYQGFGFYNENDTIGNINDLDAYVKRYPNNYDTARIVATVLNGTPKEQIIDLDDPEFDQVQ